MSTTGDENVVQIDKARGRRSETPNVEEPQETELERQTIAAQLVTMAEQSYTFGRTAQDDVYGVAKGSHVARLLRGSGSLRQDLAGRYWDQHHKVAGAQQLTDALTVIEAKALRAQPVDIHVRVAMVGTTLWLDLGDESERAVRIMPGHWEITTQCPVLFNRTKLTQAMPEPDRSGRIGSLWRVLNVSKRDQPLILAWLISTWLLVDRPCPILGLFGEQGTAKTTAGRYLSALVDPSAAEVRKPPKDEDAWVSAAVSSRVIAIDNLSHISATMSDTYCRSVTGDADVRRRLYTDSEPEVFRLKKAILMTGIDLGALRGDFAERLLRVELDTIPDERRKTEESLAVEWATAYPKILGALLTITCTVMKHLPQVRLPKKPRMADFAKILGALDIMQPKGKVLDLYLSQLDDLAADSIAGDPFITAMQSQIGSSFKGTSQRLFDLVDFEGFRAPKGWPVNARSLTGRLKKSAPSMRKVGWTVEKHDRGGRDHKTTWTIRPPHETEVRK
ncbi:ATP-binding protein [Acidipropionibacterium jensenii]|uniref:ATP-binding protein n=1 Tax=Acidipropionibacterium jensenii TaxID=1749 RepID=UPI00110A8E11|nr:ATP-binding protein [Acidipropionibacterium jensenii]QCV87057.1 ATP-binding protein [Acidipropionibacterium jensenii]